jgi:hypothetical protein
MVHWVHLVKAIESTICRCIQELLHFQTEFGHTFKAWLCTTLLNSVDQNKQILLMKLYRG